MTEYLCPVCRKPADIFAVADGGPCMLCVRARQMAVLRHRCACGRKDRQPREVVTRSRSWTECRRCLGTIVTKAA